MIVNRKLLEERENAIMSLGATSGLDLEKAENLVILDLVKSFEYAYEDISGGEYVPTIDEIYEYIQTAELISIWEVKDMLGNTYYTSNSPESTREIFGYLKYRELNTGPLFLSDLLFPRENLRDYKEVIK